MSTIDEEVRQKKVTNMRVMACGIHTVVTSEIMQGETTRLLYQLAPRSTRGRWLPAGVIDERAAEADAAAN